MGTLYVFDLYIMYFSTRNVIYMCFNGRISE